MKKLLFVVAAVLALLPTMAWARLAANHNQTRLRRPRVDRGVGGSEMKKLMPFLAAVMAALLPAVALARIVANHNRTHLYR